jgi:cytidyltransferase-like protein
MNSNSLIFSSVTFSSIFLFWKYYQKYSFVKCAPQSRQLLQSSNIQPKKIYYLQLYLPVSGSTGMPIQIHNDYLIGQVIKEINPEEGNSLLYIILENKFQISNQSILKYLSEIYSKCWDELVYQNKIHIHCIVSCDESSFQFLSKETLFQSKNLTKAYLCDESHITLLPSQLTSQDIKVYPINYYENEKIFYFDAADDLPPSSSSSSLPSSSVTSSHHFNPPHYLKIAIGGTFDQLHNGHRKLLTLAAALCSDELTIGVISDSLLTKKSNSNLIQTFQTRKEFIQDFLKDLKPSLKLNIVELHDPYGPTITEPSFEAIVVSSETLMGANMINKLRQEKGYPKLEILVIKRSDISTLSSTYLRDRMNTRTSASK